MRKIANYLIALTASLALCFSSVSVDAQSHVNVSGSWNEIAEAYTNVSGVWKKTTIDTQVGSVWENTLPIVGLTTQTIYHFAISTGVAGVRFNTDGTVDKREASTYTQINSTTDWMAPRDIAPGNYEIRSQLTSGSAPSGPALNTWHALTSTREWSVSDASGFTEAVLLIEIRLGSLTVASATYTIQAESS